MPRASPGAVAAARLDPARAQQLAAFLEQRTAGR